MVFGYLGRWRCLNLASVMSGVLFSYASIIFGECYLANLRSSEDSRNKALAKIKHSIVFIFSILTFSL